MSWVEVDWNLCGRLCVIGPNTVIHMMTGMPLHVHSKTTISSDCVMACLIYATYCQVSDHYASYIVANYEHVTVVVLDGYGYSVSTMSQRSFIANSRHKHRIRKT